ncbi:hypothetical protein C1645_731391 [Glomus cerebriforme]|uniref:Uncharacterized protein n=1 Tax=Glomus cerebriforme TaxID=658196 RepID=A0A397TKR0_9GLOM|nr:hypothetical protein C1645_731391 [Glomus cerebriforme]
MNRKRNQQNNSRDNRGQRGHNRGGRKWNNNETHSSSIIMDTSVASDPDEAARRARRAQRFGEFLEPQQLVETKFDAKIGGDIKKPPIRNEVKLSSKKSDEDPFYTMDDVEWFLGALWYALRVSKFTSNSPTIPGQRKRAQDFFFDHSPPVCLLDLRYEKNLKSVDDNLDSDSVVDNLSSLMSDISLNVTTD